MSRYEYEDDETSEDSAQLLRKPDTARGNNLIVNIAAEEPSSILKELIKHPVGVVQCAGFLLLGSVVAAVGLSAYMLYYGIIHLDSACDQPLDIFFLAFGATLLFQSMLLTLQVTTQANKKQIKWLVRLAYIPAIAELGLLGAGTYWREKVDRCNEGMIVHLSVILGLCWFMVLIGIIAKTYAKCTEPAVGQQRWK